MTLSVSSSANDPRLAHVEAANGYIESIVSGAIPACRWVKLACQRQLEDLIRAEDPAYPYRFDPLTAGKICLFIENLPHVDGVWDDANIKLLPWQQFVLTTVYGWVRKADGFRRFQRAYLSCPRKSGKSTLGAGITLYGLLFDGEKGAQVYCAANKLSQAMHVFGPAKAQVEQSKPLFGRLGVVVNAESIVVPSTNSRFVPICSNPGDGGGASTFLLDEFHEAKDRLVFDAMTRGMGARRQPLTWIVTTAGSNLAGPCYDMERDIKSILAGDFERDRTFGIVYALDDGDNWATIESARKANPSWGVSVIPDTYATELEEAIQNAALQGSFRTKRLNEWTNEARGYLNSAKWHDLSDPTLNMGDFAGQECVIGLDLASKLDLCATVTLFQRLIDGETHYFAFCHSYLPEDVTTQPGNSHYAKWVADGWLTGTPGNITDQVFILHNLLDIIAKHKVMELDFDQREAGMITQMLTDQSDVTLAEIPQQVSVLSEPLKFLQSLIVSGRIHHDGNPVFSWCIANVLAREDANENVFPRKAKYELKIDCVSALLNALSRVRAVLSPDKRKKTWSVEIW